MKRRVQFGISALLLLTLVAAIGFRALDFDSDKIEIQEVIIGAASVTVRSDKGNRMVTMQMYGLARGSNREILTVEERLKSNRGLLQVECDKIASGADPAVLLLLPMLEHRLLSVMQKRGYSEISTVGAKHYQVEVVDD